jgi:3-deoxy-7-phosphoheptulonate synthase
MAAVSSLNELDDKRITNVKPLIPPQILMEDLPLSLKAAETILDGRQGAEDIIHCTDDRLLVVVGPCSIHDIKAGLEYGMYNINDSCLMQSYLTSKKPVLTVL